MKIVCKPTRRAKYKFRMLWKRFYGMRCAYCVSTCETNYTIDHILPRSKGGTNSRTNLVLACKDCNIAKGNLLLDQFRPLLLQPISRSYYE